MARRVSGSRTCKITSNGRKLCRNAKGQWRFVKGVFSGVKKRVTARKRVSGKRKYSIGELAEMGITAISGTPGTCMTATRSKGGTQKVCFGARGRFVTPVAGLSGYRRKTRKRRSKRS